MEPTGQSLSNNRIVWLLLQQQFSYMLANRIMAQWIGQYTGKTHRTKVLRIEGTLARATESYATCHESEQKDKRRALMGVIQRLFDVKMKMLRAEVEELTEARPSEEYPKRAFRTMDEIQNLEEKGWFAIVNEYDIDPQIFEE